MIRLLELHDFSTELFWRVYDDGILRPHFIVNDVFWWATSDAEEIVPEHWEILQQASKDLFELQSQRKISSLEFQRPPSPRDPTYDPLDWPVLMIDVLYTARVRRMRPQRPWLNSRSPAMRKVFEACGPDRDPREEG